MANLQEVFTANVRRIAASKKIRPVDLARAMGQHRSVGTSILKGARRVPLKHGAAIAALLGVPLMDLLGEPGADLLRQAGRDTTSPPYKEGGNGAPQEADETTVVLQQLLAEQAERNRALETRIHALESVIEGIGAATRGPAGGQDPSSAPVPPERSRGTRTRR